MKIEHIAGILQANGKIHIRADKHTLMELKTLATIAGTTQGVLYIEKSHFLKPGELLIISVKGRGNVILLDAEQ